MKYLFYCALSLFIFSKAYPQKARTRYLHSKIFDKDSVNIFLDENYYVIEDSCALIIRYAHYDFKKSCYTGTFIDVLKHNHSQIMSEGNYSNTGLKTGKFTLYYPDGKLRCSGTFLDDKYEGDWVFYYPNGKLESKGNFKNGKYNSKWEFYFENGRPNVFMEVVDDNCNIVNCWTIDGTKTVEDGNGEYATYNSFLTWVGKLKNGVPDKTWSFKTKFAYGSEQFENGKFIRGVNNAAIFSEYTDKSKIVFLPPLPKLPIFNNEHFFFPESSVACNGLDYSKYGAYGVSVFK